MQFKIGPRIVYADLNSKVIARKFALRVICTKLENSGTTNNDTSQLLAPWEHRHNLLYRRPQKTN